jgi:hypothetical protein
VRAGGEALRDASNVERGVTLDVQLARGSLAATTTEVRAE